MNNNKNLTAFRPKKRLGQNFLVDSEIAKKLIESAKIENGDTVLEPGPGKGVITQKLLDRGAVVYAVEIDSALYQNLKESLGQNPNLVLIHQDVLDLNLKEVFTNCPYKTVGSIPYQISSPLIHKMMFANNKPETAAMITQKEFVEKVVGADGRGTYLSNFVNTWYRVQKTENIPPTAFSPSPKVFSSILLMKRRDNPYNIDLKKFSGFLHRGFANPRKMLNKAFPKEELKQAGISPSARPQDVQLEKWIKLYENTRSPQTSGSI